MHLLEHTWFLKWPLSRRTFGLWKLALCLREHNTKLNVAGKKQKTYLKAGAPAANGKRRPPMKNSATYTVVYFYWKWYQYLKFRYSEKAKVWKRSPALFWCYSPSQSAPTIFKNPAPCFWQKAGWKNRVILYSKREETRLPLFFLNFNDLGFLHSVFLPDF